MGRLTIGDVQDPITRAFQGELEDVINQTYHENRSLDEAYFLVYLRWIPAGTWVNNEPVLCSGLSIKIVIGDTKPLKFLGTACYHVNYRSGKLTRLWMLPRDNPILMQLAGAKGYLDDSMPTRSEGPMRDTELIEDAMDIKPALIHRPPGPIAVRPDKKERAHGRQ